MHSKSLIIFDFDGVIIDSHAVIRKSYNAACTEVCGEGNYPPFEEFAQHMGEVLPKIIEKLGLPQEVELAYKKFHAEFQNEILLFHKVIDFILMCNTAGKKVALVTGKYRSAVESIFDQFGFHSHFCQVVCGTDVSKSKPDPEGILKVLEDQKTPKEQAVYIGDAPNDILAAKAAGIEVISVTWGICKKEDLLALNPDYCIDREEELKEILL